MTQGIHLHLFASAVGVRSLQCRQRSTNKARARSLGIALIRLIQDKPSRPPWVSESLKLERKLQRRRRTSIEPIERENGKRSQSTLGIFDALRYSSGEHPSSWHSHHCNGRLRITVPRGCRVGDSCRYPFSRPEAGLIASARCCFSLARRNSPANGCSGLDLTLSAATTDLAVQIQQLAQHLGVHPPPPPLRHLLVSSPLSSGRPARSEMGRPHVPYYVGALPPGSRGQLFDRLGGPLLPR